MHLWTSVRRLGEERALFLTLFFFGERERVDTIEALNTETMERVRVTVLAFIVSETLGSIVFGVPANPWDWGIMVTQAVFGMASYVGWIGALLLLFAQLLCFSAKSTTARLSRCPPQPKKPSCLQTGAVCLHEYCEQVRRGRSILQICEGIILDAMERERTCLAYVRKVSDQSMSHALLVVRKRKIVSHRREDSTRYR